MARSQNIVQIYQNKNNKICLFFLFSLLCLIPVCWIGVFAANHRIIFFDMPVVHFVYHFRSKTVTQAAFFFSNLGKIYLYPLLLIFFGILLLLRKWKAFGFYGLIIIIGLLIYFTALNLVKRVRPSYFPLSHETFYSFPSGHTLHSTLFYLCIMHLTWILTKNRFITIIVSCICFLLITCIGFSRIYLGVHYPSDVLAGFLIAIAAFATAIGIKDFYLVRKQR